MLSRSSLALVIATVFLSGCGSMTRAEYERSNGLPILAEYEKNGTAVIIYGPDYDPRIDPATGAYTCPKGVRIAKYRDGVLVARFFQEDSVMVGK